MKNTAPAVAACLVAVAPLASWAAEGGLDMVRVERAGEWPWSSLRRRGTPEAEELLDDWPVPRPADWVRHVNSAQTPEEVAAVRASIKRGRPYGPDAWAVRIAKRLGLAATLRPRGRPRARHPE